MSADTVVALLPTGDIGRFPNVHVARAMLLKKYHQYIFTCADDIYGTLDHSRMSALITKIWEDNKCSPEVIPSNTRECGSMLFTLMGVYADKVFETSRKGQLIQVKDKEYNPDEGQFNVRSYWLLYDPGTDPLMDGAFLRLTPQAKACIQIILEQQKKSGEIMSEPTVFKYMMQDQKYLVTKQSKWRIFKYYRSSLISQNFLRMTK